MRILALTNLYPNPFQPQRATFNRHQFRLLNERHPLRVIAPILWADERRARRAGAPPLPPGRRVVHDGITVDHPRYWYTPKVLRGMYGRFFLWSVRRTFRAVADEFRPDLVLASWAYPDGWAAVRLAHQLGLPVVLKIHGSDVRLAGTWAGRLDGTAEALRRADGVVAVSQDLADRAIELGADPGWTRVVVNGVDRETFSPGDRAAARAAVGWRADVRHLLFVGNLMPVKGVDVLLDACTRLAERVGAWELHLVGDGEMRGRLAGQADRAGIADRVRFHGIRPHDELPDWFRAADLVVLASRSEGIPNVLLEAAACGTPFVATRVGGVPEIADQGACRLVPPEDPEQLAAAIADVLANPPPAPVQGPRDRREAAEDLADFLSAVNCQVRTGKNGTTNSLSPAGHVR
jgi:glycosyltransferase involved in cell wall biosynthesis